MRGTMKAWQIRRYGGNDELMWSESVRVPRIVHPEDVLVAVNAASLNMLDIRMRGRCTAGQWWILRDGGDKTGVQLVSGGSIGVEGKKQVYSWSVVDL
jgi:NADPH:quinone reductase-like Zn-dependent oxidoreductase